MTLTENYKSGPKTKMCFNFYKNWNLGQIEHAN